MRDRHFLLRRAEGVARRPGRRRRQCARRPRRAVEPAAARDPADAVAGSARRLRPRCPGPRPHRRRRGAAPARIRDLRRDRRRVRPVVCTRARAAPRPDVAHGALGADAAPAAGPDRALRRGRARDRDDGDGAGGCSSSSTRAPRTRSSSSRTVRRRSSARPGASSMPGGGRAMSRRPSGASSGWNPASCSPRSG